ncbi:MAG TPA: hypothetical protein VFK57_21590 [Vicinamibacterales bacterium]|nr:hypothetical protein [Vicinamibacterales bacterium]
MHAVKLENFARDHPGRAFPWFRTLDAGEARLAAKLGTDADGEGVVRVIFDRSRLLANVDADDDTFEPKSVFDSLSIQPTSKVVVNWYHFDQIDEMHFRDLNAFFADIWYPAADDIDILDETPSWVVSIRTRR